MFVFWSSAEKGLTTWLSFDCIYFVFGLFPMYGTNLTLILDVD